MSRAPDAARKPGWHWSEYWRSGRTEVMTVDSQAGRSAFDAAPLWRDFFASFDDGARILDLATGAGQVARYAAEAAAQAARRFEVTGVDYADLGPHQASAPAGCTLQGGVMLEKLPFADAHFDGASSQFGIEYAEPKAALAELARVLKPGGRALMLIHHAASAITRSTADQLAAHEKVLGEGAAVRQGRRAFTAHLKRLRPEAVREAEAAFRDAVARAQSRLEPAPAFETVRYAVGYLADLAARAAAYEPASALARLEFFEADNAAWRQRHRSQLKAAMDAPALDAFLQKAERSGLAVTERAEQTDGRDALVAWRVSLAKA
jgi:SAM-dependent methyltransferase